MASIVNNNRSKYDSNQRTVRLSSGLQFIFLSYKPEFWYWEIIEVFRRLLLAAGIQAMFNDSLTQIIVAISLSIGFIAVNNKCLPYESDEDNIIANVGQFQVLLTYFCLWILMQNSIDDIPAGYIALDYSLTLGNLLSICLNIFISWKYYDDSPSVDGGSSQTLKYINFEYDIKKYHNISNLCDKKLILDYLYTKASSDDILAVQTMIVENILRKFRKPSRKYVFYCVQEASAGKIRQHEDRNKNSLYLEMWNDDMDAFMFLCPQSKAVGSETSDIYASDSSDTNYIQKDLNQLYCQE
jgi:hypothetical protein